MNTQAIADRSAFASLHLRQLRHALQARRVVWILCALLFVFVGWASLASLDEVVVGNGKVIPSRAVQKIQSLEGGILKRVLVEEGQTVSAGEVLVELDDTRFRSSFDEAEQNLNSLSAMQAELKALLDSVRIVDSQVQVHRVAIDGKKLDAPALARVSDDYVGRLADLEAGLAASDQQIAQQAEAYREAERAIITNQDSLDLLDKEIEATDAAVRSAALPVADLRRLQRDRVKLVGDLDAARLQTGRLKAAAQQAQSERLKLAAEFRAKTQGELTEIESKLYAANGAQPALVDQLQRTRLTAPLRGTVKNIDLRSVGGVIKPGEPIMEIVPLDDKLLMEARVSPKDVGRLRSDMQAVVKFSAYDFVIYGGLKGKVVNVSSDALQDEDGNPYYKVKVETDQQSLRGNPIIPGMQVTVDIITGKKTVMSYLLKPLLRARAVALREK